MKILFLALLAISTLSVTARAETDLDDLDTKLDEIQSKLDDINDKLDALSPDPDPVYNRAPRKPSYVLVPVNTEHQSTPKPKDIPGGYWVESDNPQIGWHWIKGSPSKSGRFTDK